MIVLFLNKIRNAPLKNGGDHSFAGRFGPLRNRPPVLWYHFPDSSRQDGENSEKTEKKRAKMGEIWPNKKSAGRRPILDGYRYEGVGRMKYKEGSQYKGTYLNGRRHGEVRFNPILIRFYSDFNPI